MVRRPSLAQRRMMTRSRVTNQRQGTTRGDRKLLLHPGFCRTLDKSVSVFAFMSCCWNLSLMPCLRRRPCSQRSCLRLLGRAVFFVCVGTPSMMLAPGVCALGLRNPCRQPHLPQGDCCSSRAKTHRDSHDREANQGPANAFCENTQTR